MCPVCCAKEPSSPDGNSSAAPAEAPAPAEASSEGPSESATEPPTAGERSPEPSGWCRRGVLKPDIVFFGENLGDHFRHLINQVPIRHRSDTRLTVLAPIWYHSDNLLTPFRLLIYQDKAQGNCDLVLVMGSSLAVGPVNMIPNWVTLLNAVSTLFSRKFGIELA